MLLLNCILVIKLKWKLYNNELFKNRATQLRYRKYKKIIQSKTTSVQKTTNKKNMTWCNACTSILSPATFCSDNDMSFKKKRMQHSQFTTSHSVQKEGHVLMLVPSQFRRRLKWKEQKLTLYKTGMMSWTSVETQSSKKSERKKKRQQHLGHLNLKEIGSLSMDNELPVTICHRCNKKRKDKQLKQKKREKQKEPSFASEKELPEESEKKWHHFGIFLKSQSSKQDIYIAICTEKEQMEWLNAFHLALYFIQNETRMKELLQLFPDGSSIRKRILESLTNMSKGNGPTSASGAADSVSNWSEFSVWDEYLEMANELALLQQLDKAETMYEVLIEVECSIQQSKRTDCTDWHELHESYEFFLSHYLHQPRKAESHFLKLFFFLNFIFILK
ncbi:hypothetical protein RFI_20172 [Reticulomyxa filosa]|uniref:PH domain-containing protein n=1 Tax=Reticulomyxa filosa TaxID=46433 RepID=X6MTH7_RETFI|nr:hypothetical protein RFI_20172 [Reticulomyxa filosa]|eukprot:ETO17159.1 hypothetical protein RFI_20172 [Reticulomyxa filosa]